MGGNSAVVVWRGHRPGVWQGYSLDTGLELAAAMFRAKYGYASVEVLVAGAVILAGPIGVESVAEAAERYGLEVEDG